MPQRNKTRGGVTVEQLTLYDLLYEKYKITKPIRLIELFSGYGSQALALKYLGVNFTHWRICEWATKSIQAYNDLHIRDYTDYSKELSQDAVIERLAAYGISMDYNKPMTLEQIQRKGEAWERKTYNNIIATHNLVDVSKAKAKDLNIIDTSNFTYLLTYSFPCQDLSIAGKRKGMSRDAGTRSGMLWQVERLLDELTELPQVLLMENVPDVIGQTNINDFHDWQLKLEKLGYKNYVKVLNSKDFQIPQHRERCFMVSVLGDYNFNFPKSTLLKTPLKQILKNSTDKKLYISADKIKEIFSVADTDEITLKQIIQLEGKFESIGRVYSIDGVAPTINTCGGGQREPKIFDTTVCLNSKVNGKQPSLNDRVYSSNGCMPAVTTTPFFMGNVLINGVIRKLSSNECWRLMGVKDADYNNVATNQSQSSLYHLAGDSIVTAVLMAIFGELLGIDYKTKIAELVEDLKECA